MPASLANFSRSSGAQPSATAVHQSSKSLPSRARARPSRTCSLRTRERRAGFQGAFPSAQVSRAARTSLLVAKSVPDLDSHMHMDLYQILGLEGQAATMDEIRSSYKYLAKQAHPDISGDENSDAFALINKAYEVLSDPSAKLMYDSGRSLFGENSAFADFTGEALSHNAMPGHPSASFVDENTCIGCRACVHEAPNTFMIDEAYGKARVETQWADAEEKIAVAREMCPVNCIHLVAAKDLPVLEFVQRSMVPRHMIINSDQTSSGGARGMEESPFVAAERFEAKKAKLLADAQARAKAARKMNQAMESLWKNGIIPGSWLHSKRGRWGSNGKGESPGSPICGPSCPLIIRPGGRLLLPAPEPGPDEHRPGV